MKKENPRIDSLGNKSWTNWQGILHREGDLPAIEFFDGRKAWFLNGLIYRWDEWIEYWL